jgi:hypothetical protein
MSKKPATTRESQKLTVAERRAFIWASPRIHSKGAPGPYYLCSRTPTEAEPICDADIAVEKHGVKAAFDYLYGHANITRATCGYWAVGHRANNTRKILTTSTRPPTTPKCSARSVSPRQPAPTCTERRAPSARAGAGLLGKVS